MTDISTDFYALPDEMKEAAKTAACERFRVEDFFDLTPAQRQQVYRDTVIAQFA